jgi:glycosyltransferase involved in cell wall biosynthesis
MGTLKKSKILVVANNVPPAHSGAGIDNVRNYSLLLEAGLPIEVSFVANKLTEDLKLPQLPMKIRRILNPFRPKQLTKWPLDFIRILQHASQADVVHFNGSFPPALFAIPFTRLLGKKTILQLHCMDVDDPAAMKRNLRRKVAYWCYKKAHVFKTYTPCQTNALLGEGFAQERVFEIPPFVDTELFSPVDGDTKENLRKRFDVPKDGIILCSIGQIGLRKGSDVVLDMMDEIQKKRDDVYLLIAGPHIVGHEDTPAELSARIQEASKSSHIRVLGQVADIESVFRASDFFVLPSRAEGFGIVLVEALASGCITVVSKLEGIFDSIITDNHDGFIIKDYNGKSYAEKILQLIDSPKKLEKVRSSGFQRVNSKYTKGRLISAFQKLISP